MRKGMMAVYVLCLAGGLSACGSYEGALDGRYDDRARPIGYYSNEHERYAEVGYDYRNKRNGNAYIMNDNDGPVTELLERSAVNRVSIDHRRDNGRREMVNPTVPLAERDRNFFERDNRFGYADRNYHGHLNLKNAKTRPSYYNKYDGKLAEKIANRAESVNNVKDARALVYRDSVLVAVNTKSANTDHIERAVARAIAPYTKNKNVRVVSNPSMYHRVRVIDNNLRNGGPFDETERDLKTIFNFNNGEIIERPANRR